MGGPPSRRVARIGHATAELSDADELRSLPAGRDMDVLDQFLGWLNDNASLVSALTSVIMAVVWVVYAQLFFFQYSRQQRPRIFIDQAQGHGHESVCLLINLSQQPIYVSCVLLAASLPDGQVVKQLIEDRALNLEEATPQTIEGILKQGPLESAGFLSLGTFGDLLRHVIHATVSKSALQGDGTEHQRMQEYARMCPELEIRVISMFGANDYPIASSRTFRVDAGDSGIKIRPVELYTQQLASRWQRGTVLRWMGQCEEV